MAKLCKNLSYNNKNLHDFNLITVDFDNGGGISLGLEQEVINGNKTKYRPISNQLGREQADNLEFEIHLMKNPCGINSDRELIWTREELRAVARWLTSNNYNKWLSFEYRESHDENIEYCGTFDLQEYTINNQLYGVRAIFRNNSAYGYVKGIKTSKIIHGFTSMEISSDSDLVDEYTYPTLRITPSLTGDMYLISLNDCEIFKEGTMTVSGNKPTDFLMLQAIVEEYANLKKYEYEYYKDITGEIKNYGDYTALQVNFKSIWGESMKCFAFFDKETGNYKIVEGGYFFMDIKSSLPITMNSNTKTIYDDLGRMIKFEDMGIADVDYIYWLRLMQGSNEILICGDCDIEIEHFEYRKVGAF